MDAERRLADTAKALAEAEAVKAGLLRDSQLALGNQGDLKQSLNLARAKVSKLESQVRPWGAAAERHGEIEQCLGRHC